jgi:hypothetical protein
MTQASNAICSYCAKATLTGDDEPEHAIPAAINGRYTTRTVCVSCNRWAGQYIDFPWLNDPIVLDVRRTAKVPDRRGNLLQRSPLLAGTTDDGRRVALGADGKPVLLNSVVDRGDDQVRIIAPDEATLDALMEREKRKAEATGKTWTPGVSQRREDRPYVEVSSEISPAVWERMGAKMGLAILADTMPSDWRTSSSADLLRTRMRDMSRPASQASLLPTDASDPFAAAPATAITITSITRKSVLSVSLMGIFTVRFLLAADCANVDLTVVSDPINQAHSAKGTLAQVIYQRHKALGLL